MCGARLRICARSFCGVSPVRTAVRIATGALLPDDASGDNVIAEYFRDGVDGIIGLDMMVDGGFAMGSDLPLFAAGETEADLVDTVTTSDGQQKSVPKKANFGTLSSGGLY